MTNLPTAEQQDQHRQIKEDGLDWNREQRNKGEEEEPTAEQLLGETPFSFYRCVDCGCDINIGEFRCGDCHAILMEASK